MAMSIQEAMAMIANVQAALIQHGHAVGTYGPCKDGIDGRYGPATRAGLASFAAAGGMAFDQVPSDPVLAALFEGPALSGVQFGMAVNTWNHFRSTTPSYPAAADKILCEATGVCGGERCPGAAPPAPPPDGGGAPLAPTGGVKEGGIPWWFWALMITAGDGFAGFIGWQIYEDRKGKKKTSRSTKTAPVFSGDYTGKKITSTELGEDDDSYEGYGQADAADEADDGYS